MDASLIQDFMSQFASSDSTLSSLPSALLDATIPGYGIVSQIIFRLSGIDIGLLAFSCLVLFGLFQGGYLLYYRVLGYFNLLLSSDVEIEENDYLFGQALRWMAKQRMTKNSRTLKAKTRWASEYEDEDNELEDENDDVLDQNGIFNYEKWASSIPPQYEPKYGADRFQYNGRTFTLSRTKLDDKRNLRGDSYSERLSIRCNGRSTKHKPHQGPSATHQEVDISERGQLDVSLPPIRSRPLEASMQPGIKID